MQLRTKRGYELARVISTIQKAIRRNDARVAGYFAMEAVSSGYGAYCWRRLLIISAEDCAAIVTGEIQALYDAWTLVGNKMSDKERWLLAGRVFVSKAIILLCTAAKSRDADHLGNLVHEAKGISDAEAATLIEEADGDALEVPAYADDCHTQKGKRAGLTRRDFFLTEDAALTPRGPTLFDAEIDRLRAGELHVADRDWRRKR